MAPSAFDCKRVTFRLDTPRGRLLESPFLDWNGMRYLSARGVAHGSGGVRRWRPIAHHHRHYD